MNETNPTAMASTAQQDTRVGSDDGVAEPRGADGVTPDPNLASDKNEQLEHVRVAAGGTQMTTDQGVRVTHTEDSLKAGTRGPTLLEDFHFREKITHFDHESIPERVVHARGTGAHGYFQPYESAADITAANFLADPARKTPVFARFSQVL